MHRDFRRSESVSRTRNLCVANGDDTNDRMFIQATVKEYNSKRQRKHRIQIQRLIITNQYIVFHSSLEHNETDQTFSGGSMHPVGTSTRRRMRWRDIVCSMGGGQKIGSGRSGKGKRREPWTERGREERGRCCGKLPIILQRNNG